MRRASLCIFLAACSTRGLTDGDTPPRDAVAPTLDVRTPLRGSIAAGASSIEVRGYASDDTAVARVVVNDLPAQLAADGSFVSEVPAAGLTFIHTEAFDAAGNRASDSRAVLAGAVAPIATPVPHAFHAHLDPAALALVGAVASQLLGDLDVGPIATALNPLVDLPIPCFSIRVDVTEARKGKVTVGLAADPDGLAVDAEVDALEVGLHVGYELACDGGEADVTLSAGAFHLTGILGLAVDDGHVAMTADQTSARF